MKKRKPIIFFLLLLLIISGVIILLIPERQDTERGHSTAVQPQKTDIESSDAAGAKTSASEKREETGGKAANLAKQENLRNSQKGKRASMRMPESENHPKLISGNAFIKKLAEDIPKMQPSMRDELRSKLLETSKLKPDDVALQLIRSKLPETRKFAMRLIAGICITRPDAFHPNTFYKIFASNGTASSPYLAKIIDETDDDFIREWACELASDIYYYNSPEDDSRHIKLAEFKKKEKKMYSFVKDILNNKAQLKELLKSKGDLGSLILRQWGRDRRIPMKMQAVISTLDLMDQKNSEACFRRTLKILKTYNFNYNILGHLNGKQLEVPAVPPAVKALYLANTVLASSDGNTFRWLSRDRGGFSEEDLKIAIETKNLPELRRMNQVMKKILTDVLKVKIMIGLGQNELNILRRFNYAVWGDDGLKSRYRLVVLKNKFREPAHLLLEIESQDDFESAPFYIPGREKFVWLLPAGKYKVRPYSKATIRFLGSTFELKNKNISIDIEK